MHKMTARFAFPLLAASLALSACGSNPGSATRSSIRAVGSSTVYPFAKIVAENFARANPNFGSPIIESTGSGAGLQLFCKGIGADHPDIADASRRIKLSEFQECQANNVKDIAEIQVGLDGIAFASAKGGITLKLTPEAIYKALAAKPFGKDQTAKTWADVDPKLPAKPILVYGPPSTSGTRDALEELILQRGCESNPAMEALKKADEGQFKKICTDIRSDGAYVDSGENDNLIVQKIEANPDALGIFGYSYLDENSDKIEGQTINGTEPTYDNISTFAYPGARPLFIYVKKAHLDAIPGIREYVAEWAKEWGKDGPLAKKGLVTSPPDVLAKSAAAATGLPSLSASDLQ